MKKQSIMNLVRYHVEKNEEAFISEVAEIAKSLIRMGILQWQTISWS